jgi:adenylate cyclase
VELDVFHDALAGLIVAEVEFDSERALSEFQPPPWFGREVTDDVAYTNAALAGKSRPV